MVHAWLLGNIMAIRVSVSLDLRKNFTVLFHNRSITTRRISDAKISSPKGTEPSLSRFLQ